ncbi:ATP-binding protein [Streptomyces sp. NPDC003717]|uniref:ATP-binding protein n=1 Tax=Streptomyces sp. NPDC003717 TaxID=3154276 RepID=UPI0033BF5267
MYVHRTSARPVVLLGWEPSLPAPTGPARARLRGALARAGADRSAVDAAVLVCSELVANAHEHGHGPCELRLTLGARVCVEVLERGPGPSAGVCREARRADLGGGRERGRGLALVDRLTAGSWGVRAVPGGGACVWARPLPD